MSHHVTNTRATLSQTLATVPGAKYRLSLWLNNSISGLVEQFQVNWNGNPIFNLVNPPAFSRTNLQIIVTALTNNAVLQFGVENDPDYFGLDDISVTPIPSVALKAFGHSSSTFDFTWKAATGVVYQVQYKTNLLQPNWLDFGIPFLATNSSVNISDPVSSRQRSYRDSVLP